MNYKLKLFLTGLTALFLVGCATTDKFPVDENKVSVYLPYLDDKGASCKYVGARQNIRPGKFHEFKFAFECYSVTKRIEGISGDNVKLFFPEMEDNGKSCKNVGGRQHSLEQNIFNRFVFVFDCPSVTKKIESFKVQKKPRTQT